MAVLHLEHREVHLYDSFGRRPAWHQDVQVRVFWVIIFFDGTDIQVLYIRTYLFFFYD